MIKSVDVVDCMKYLHLMVSAPHASHPHFFFFLGGGGGGGGRGGKFYTDLKRGELRKFVTLGGTQNLRSEL